MTPRDVTLTVLRGSRPPYVPWHMSFTQEAHQKLREHYGQEDVDPFVRPHIAWMEWPIVKQRLPNGRMIDEYGVQWDQSVDHDIGVVENRILPEPSLKGFHLPPAIDQAVLASVNQRMKAEPSRLRLFGLGLSLYERAWTLRGMPELMMDFLEHPGFVHELLDVLADQLIKRTEAALTCDVDIAYFGDDWGQQQGLQMGYATWKEFIYPRLRRMYAAARGAGRPVLIHSCGDVDELFEDLIAAGVNCFNPFQPEVLDVAALVPRYRGRLTFCGGMSTQKVLPFATPEGVRAETRRLIDLGREGGLIVAPAHAVEGDVPLENMLAMIDELQSQPGYDR